jgi:phage terminase large subunit GpA-like protein
VTSREYVDALRLLAAAWSEAIRPDPVILPSEWIEANVLLQEKSSKTPGPFRFSLAPHLREIADCFALDSGIDEVHVQKGVQLGVSTLALALMGFWIDQHPGPIMYVMPNVDLAKALSKERLQPMLLDVSALRAKVIEPKHRDGDNTILYKEFLGGFITLTGANSPAGFRFRSIRYLVIDEGDEFPADVGGQGDPGELARGRMEGMEGVGKILNFSSPTIHRFSSIEREVNTGDRRVRMVPCPRCGGFQQIDWGRIRWDGENPDTAHMICLHCERRIDEREKYEMNLAGRWEPTAASVNPRVRSYVINALYSNQRTWSARVRRWLRIGGHREKLKVFVNIILAETWKEPGATVDQDSLRERLEPFPARAGSDGAPEIPLIPRRVLFLTAGVDVQKYGWEVAIVGWGLHEEAWGVEYLTIYGDTDRKDEWESLLGPVLDRTWEHELGYPCRLQATCIDSGFLPRKVYDFCHARPGRRIFATKGRDEAGRPIVGAPSKRRSGKDRRKVQVQIIGTDDARADLLARLARPKPELDRAHLPHPNYIHLPLGRGYTTQTLEQLTAMTSEMRYRHGVGRRIWILKPGARKEAFDCWMNAVAAMILFNPSWKSLEASRERIERERSGELGEAAGDEPSPTPPQPPPPPRRTRRPRSRGGWVTGWKQF